MKIYNYIMVLYQMDKQNRRGYNARDLYLTMLCAADEPAIKDKLSRSMDVDSLDEFRRKLCAYCKNHIAAEKAEGKAKGWDVYIYRPRNLNAWIMSKNWF